MVELQEAVVRLWSDLLAQPSGPFGLRFMLQPLLATVCALRDGLKDASCGRAPFLWTLRHDAAMRSTRLREGLLATATIIVACVLTDAAYQLQVQDTFHVREALVLAVVLGLVPYVALRGAVDRTARRWFARRTPLLDAAQPRG